MKKLTRIFLLVAATSFFVACSDDDNGNNDTPLGVYDNGVFVLNEGISGPATASVTFISDAGLVEQNVFTNVNPSSPMTGSYLQSMFFDDTRAFIISGQANKITVVNRYTFEFIASIDTNFENPRYGAVINGKAYVTNYADYAVGTDDFLTVIDLSDYSTSKVALNNWSEKVIEENGKLYIANGYYGSGTSITVFNPANNSLGTPIELGFSPNSLEEEDGILYVIGGGKLAKINLSNNQVIGTAIAFPEDQAGAKNLTIEDDKIYYTVGTNVYVMNINATTAPTAKLFSYESTSVWAAMYGFAVNDNKIYVADGGNLTSDSAIYVYSLTGTLLDTYAAGIGANGFYFND
ncbi:DUF5074 domain-containing protein [Flavobacterium sp. PLA-1-15]|uniref:DUF5074 domain-containing protein n=1 Tax=Flavobacterium sp. PLA-1-15 TaxID=3380533 RepID=UPI003B7620DE